jgi:hypothetical protein
MQKLRRLSERLRRNSAGNALVETALYLPVALVMFGGMVDFSLAVSQKLRAQQAVARTLEMASNIGFSGLELQSLRAEAAKAANVGADRVEAKIWLECDGIEQTGSFPQCNSSDALARYASITIQDNYQLLLYSALTKTVQKSDTFRLRVHGSLRIQ